MSSESEGAGWVCGYCMKEQKPSDTQHEDCGEIICWKCECLRVASINDLFVPVL